MCVTRVRHSRVVRVPRRRGPFFWVWLLYKITVVSNRFFLSSRMFLKNIHCEVSLNLVNHLPVVRNSRVRIASRIPVSLLKALSNYDSDSSRKKNSLFLVKGSLANMFTVLLFCIFAWNTRFESVFHLALFCFYDDVIKRHVLVLSCEAAHET